MRGSAAGVLEELAPALTTLDWACGLALLFGEANWTAGPADHPNMVGRAHGQSNANSANKKGLNQCGDQKNIRSDERYSDTPETKVHN